MAFGDTGGAITELIITLKTATMGIVNIKKGDAVALIGNYTVDNTGVANQDVLGQALENLARLDRRQPVTPLPAQMLEQLVAARNVVGTAPDQFAQSTRDARGTFAVGGNPVLALSIATDVAEDSHPLWSRDLPERTDHVVQIVVAVVQ